MNQLIIIAIMPIKYIYKLDEFKLYKNYLFNLFVQ